MQKIWNVKIDGRGMDQLEIIESLLESRGVEDCYEFLNPSSDELIPFEKLKISIKQQTLFWIPLITMAHS